MKAELPTQFDIIDGKKEAWIKQNNMKQGE